MYPIQNYVIKFVSDLRQVRFFLPVYSCSLHQYHWPHDIAEILLKVALNTITLWPQIFGDIFYVMGLSLSICRFNRFDVFTFVLLVWSFNTMILGKEWRLWLIAPRHFLYVRHLLFICFSKMHTFLCHNYCFWHKKRQNCDEFQIFLNFFLFSSNFNLCMHHAPLDTALYLWLVPHWHVLIRCPVLDNILLLPFFHYEQKLKRLLLQFLLLLYSAHHMDMYILIVGVDWNIFPTGDKFWKLFDQDIRVLMIKMYSLSVTSGRSVVFFGFLHR